ncbi:uncharacterized protein DSM5745_06424 [Aspergillus mulundensis]|uniref:DUF7905 domain-containing protein n=1 Tax=Aspergillus mulundensis TaxID=1810919 RepID=A0A3D8RQS0_9EURO|nr:Uncharacterized protein DSM5745_06424 [Aspergillus mulundensis]RDW76432.1 Uncharacterized protein DSM5745_06424 [Aspergillus mulundensis]
MDHETSGALEWNLVGYGRAAAKKKAVASDTQAQASQLSQAPQASQKPQTSQISRAQAPQAPQASRGPQPQTPHLQTRRAMQSGPQQRPQPTAQKVTGPPSRAVAVNRETSNGRARGFPRGRAANPRAAVSGQPNNPLGYSPAKLKFSNGLKPDGVVDLSAPFGTIKHDFFGAARSGSLGRHGAAGHNRTGVFEDISKRSGAFVKMPVYEDRVIKIWGEPIQVAAAEGQLKSILSKCSSLNKPKATAHFAKVKAYSEKKEANVESKERGEGMLFELRRQPAPISTFPEPLLFLWPEDGPSLNECFGPDLESLDPIRIKYSCYLFVPKELPGFICALGENHDGKKQIAKSIRILWAEAAAKSNIKTKIYLVEPPEPNAMKREIVVKKQNHNQLHNPVLQGARLKGRTLQEWQGRISSVQSKNNTRLLTAVESCLKGLSFVRGHLRMRVNLGTFVLETYQKPEDDKSWYAFEEFRGMILHEQTQGRLIPGLKIGQTELLERCFKARELLEPLDKKSTSLEDAELAYSANFEFVGADKSMLRLEAEFAKSPLAREYEIKERRWLRPRTDGQTRDKRPPLHAAVIDFERSDWQLEIKALEFHEAASINSALKAFSYDISFQHTENVGDIRAKAEKKVKFPRSPPVARYVEKSAVRYRIKGTNYIFEIARYDEYRREGVPTIYTGGEMLGSMSATPYTSWGASVFDPNWDNLLGGHANLGIGQTAKYNPNLATFFPSIEPSPKPEDQAKGFWEFIGIVKQAAGLLGPTRTSTDPEVDAASEAESLSKKADRPLESTSASPTAPAAGPVPSPRMLNADLGTLF